MLCEYDTSRENELNIDELHVLASKGDEYNFYTVNVKKQPDTSVHICIGATYENKDHKWMHFYDIIPKQAVTKPYIIHLRYRKQRFLCHICNHAATIPTTFAAAHAHYTVRFEKWISQLCISDSFANVAKLIGDITPPPTTEADKNEEKLISESGIKKIFMRWVNSENGKYLERIVAPNVLGIHKTKLRDKCYYLLTNPVVATNVSELSTIIWMAQDIEEIKELVEHMYNRCNFPERVLVDWSPDEELIAFATKQFTLETEIVIDYKRVSKYISEYINKDVSTTWLNRSIETLKEHSSNENKTYVWEDIKMLLASPDCSSLSNCAQYIKNSIWPSLIETDDNYWHNIENINDLMLNCTDYGCSADVLRACILYAYKRPYDEEYNTYKEKHMFFDMSASSAARYLSVVGLSDRKQVFSLQHSSLFTNEPFNTFINCLFNENYHANYGVPFETASKNLYSVIRYNQAYEYYLAHKEEVSQLMEDTLFYD